MNEENENMDLYDDSGVNDTGDDPAAGSGAAGPVNGEAGDPVSPDPGDEQASEDPSNDDPGTDGTDREDQEADGESSPETEDGDKTEETPEDGLENEEDTEGEETEAVPAVDPEILLDIRDTLHNHADSVNGFINGLTVSGNMLQVSLDSGSTALLTESVDRQDKILDAIDGMSGLIALVFFVLAFDLIHRFAKRIIKNFMGGGKNGTNS